MWLMRQPLTQTVVLLREVKMFNPKIYERAREIVAQADVTALVDRVYRQITAEAELNRLQKRNTTTLAVDVAECVCENRHIGEEYICENCGGVA